MKPEHNTMDRFRLFTVSFLTLFLELALIRFVPANVRLIGYFTNLILLGAFLGIGTGLLMTNRKVRLFMFFPWILGILLTIIMVLRIEVTVNSPSALFFKGVREQGVNTDPTILLPILFGITAFVFATISQELGRLFKKFRPLSAYSLDLFGALSAIILFSLFSYIGSSPFWWFVVVAVASLCIFGRPKNFIQLVALIPVLTIPFIPLMTPVRSVWSPYAKLTVTKEKDISLGTLYAINANNISHQFITDYRLREDFYFTPYDAFPPPAGFKNILIIGAGTGADVAAALALNPDVVHIDAVEIDPMIVRLGKLLHPNRPFYDPRVTTIIDDGRSYLERTNKKYDLIIFALTDSVVITSNTSNIRLESFLFTQEAFRLVKNRLTDSGLFVMYNYYRQQWLIDRIAVMAHTAFGEYPFVQTYGDTGRAATFLAGPKTKHITALPSLARYQPTQDIAPASDDWPFIYVKDQAIPPIYRGTLGAISIISIIFVAVALRGNMKMGFFPNYFFLGLGFLLLETKNLVTFGLLFGNTWVVNAMVFAAILTSALLATLLSQKWTIKPIWILYALLFITLIANAIIPAHMLLQLPHALRYITASVFYFSPIFIANFIFSQTFKNEYNSSTALGINMLGAMAGGILEYLAMIVGYQMLYGLVIVSYILALVRWKK